MDLLKMARELAALSQSGLHYTKSEFERERYQRIQEISNELLSKQGGLTINQVAKWNENEYGYATPKVDVRGFVLQNHKVLLVRENLDGGRWTLPGGYADVNETPSEAVEREVLEESGYIVNTQSMLAVYDRDKQGHEPPYPFHIYKLFFHCKLIGGKPTPNIESSESSFFDPYALPELSKGRVLDKQIRLFYERIQAGTTETLFD